MARRRLVVQGLARRDGDRAGRRVDGEDAAGVAAGQAVGDRRPVPIKVGAGEAVADVHHRRPGRHVFVQADRGINNVRRVIDRIDVDRRAATHGRRAVRHAVGKAGRRRAHQIGRRVVLQPGQFGRRQHPAIRDRRAVGQGHRPHARQSGHRDGQAGAVDVARRTETETGALDFLVDRDRARTDDRRIIDRSYTDTGNCWHRNVPHSIRCGVSEIGAAIPVRIQLEIQGQSTVDRSSVARGRIGRNGHGRISVKRAIRGQPGKLEGSDTGARHRVGCVERNDDRSDLVFRTIG